MGVGAGLVPALGNHEGCPYRSKSVVWFCTSMAQPSFCQDARKVYAAAAQARAMDIAVPDDFGETLGLIGESIGQQRDADFGSKGEWKHRHIYRTENGRLMPISADEIMSVTVITVLG